MVVNKIVALSQLQNIIMKKISWGGRSLRGLFFFNFECTKKGICVRQLNWLIGACPKTPLGGRVCTEFVADILSDKLSNILSDVLNNILSDTLSDVLTPLGGRVCTEFVADILSDKLSNILSDVLNNILSDTLSDVLSHRLSNTQTYMNGILASFGLMHLT